jgi:hypothetical protein
VCVCVCVCVLCVHVCMRVCVCVPSFLLMHISSRETVKGVDMGDEVAAWLSDVIGDAVRMVRLPHAFDRSPPDAFVEHLNSDEHTNAIAYPDCFPFLLASEASRAWVEKTTQGIAEDPKYGF